jgi:hypothetical protein
MFFIFNAACIVPEESMRLVLPITSCFLIEIVFGGRLVNVQNLKCNRNIILFNYLEIYKSHGGILLDVKYMLHFSLKLLLKILFSHK